MPSLVFSGAVRGITLDRMYNEDVSDPLHKWLDQLSGDFTLFGGTSAASAIAAGAGVLVIAAAKSKRKPCDGPSVKRILKETCVLEFEEAEAPKGRRPLHPDRMNENPKTDPPFVFGAGLINVKKALALAGD
jgi:hypothetical protein